MKKLCLIIPVCFFCLGCVVAQPIIGGSVTDANTSMPVPAASVFISNSSAGIFTDNNGNFILKRVPEGRFTLVVSCVGYETFVKDFQGAGANLTIKIVLRRKATDLDEIVVTPMDKNGWINWGSLFIEQFIGTSSYASACRIKNPKVLKFRLNQKDSILTVSADEPLIIENKSLGYIMKYDLKEFTYYFYSNAVRYSGYAFFEEISSDEKTSEKYKENRMKVYAVSFIHFIRSLYNETSEAEGFKIIRRLNKTAVELKKADKKVVQEYNGEGAFDTIYEISNANTQIKIVAIQRNNEIKNDMAVTDRSSLDNIFSRENGNNVLNFHDTLQVVYTGSKAPSEYIKYTEGTHNGNAILSEISLIKAAPVMIMSNGSFTPSAIAMTGFWAWWEKISIMLPYDYAPASIARP